MALDENGDHAIIAVDQQPAGYIRWNPVPRLVLDMLGLHDIPAGSIDIDVLLGDVALTGQGVGPRALDLLTQTLTRDGAKRLFGLTTSVENIAAQKAFGRAGFVKDRIYQAPGLGACWLMIKAP